MDGALLGHREGPGWKRGEGTGRGGGWPRERTETKRGCGWGEEESAGGWRGDKFDWAGRRAGRCVMVSSRKAAMDADGLGERARAGESVGGGRGFRFR